MSTCRTLFKTVKTLNDMYKSAVETWGIRMNKNMRSTINKASSELMERGEVESIAEYFTSDYVAHLTEKDFKGGHATIEKAIAMYRAAFPDIRVTIEVLVEHADRIAWQRTLRATHSGNFRGFPPTGRPIVWNEMVTSRFEGDLIAEEWVVSDLAERLLVASKDKTK